VAARVRGPGRHSRVEEPTIAHLSQLGTASKPHLVAPEVGSGRTERGESPVTSQPATPAQRHWRGGWHNARSGPGEAAFPGMPSVGIEEAARKPARSRHADFPRHTRIACPAAAGRDPRLRGFNRDNGGQSRPINGGKK